jgi:peptidyl-prolyl cis-trans isomerase C
MERTSISMCRKYFVIFLISLLLAGCGGKEEQKAPEFDLTLQVASVDDTTFTLNDLNDRLVKEGWLEHSNLKRIKDTAEFNLKTLDKMIVDYLVDQSADTFDIDTIFMAQRRLKEQMGGYALLKLRQDLLDQVIEVTDADVDTFYQNNLDRFFNPARARAAHILISVSPRYYVEEGEDYSSLSADTLDFMARELMAEVIEKLEDGEPFEELAREYSHDRNSGQNGGVVGWVQKGTSPDAFDEALFSLEPGEISPAVRTEHGYHLIKLLEKEDSSYTELTDELRAQIKQGLTVQLQRNYSTHFMDSIRQAADVRYNESLLRKPDSTAYFKDWMAIINGTDTVFVYDYREYSNTYQARNRLSKLTVDNKKEILEGFVANRALLHEARKRGYFEGEDFEAQKKRFISLQKRHQFRLLGQAPLWEPTEDELRAFYESHEDEYFSNQPLKVQHILFDDSLKAEKVRQEILNGADFEEMAMKYYPGDEQVRKSLYDIGYISRDEISPEFFDAAWILDIGDVSRPVRTEYGYHLIKLLDKKPVDRFENARLRVRKRMLDEYRDSVYQEWKNNLIAGHVIDIDSTLTDEFVFQQQAVDTAIQAIDTMHVSQDDRNEQTESGG